MVPFLYISAVVLLAFLLGRFIVYCEPKEDRAGDRETRWYHTN